MFALLLFFAAGVRADFVFVNEFESIDTLYVNSTPYTIEVLDGFVVNDTASVRDNARAAAWLHSPVVGEISAGIATMSRR